MFRHQLCIERDVIADFSSPPRLTFGTGVDRCDDSVGHNRGCQCRHDLSLS